MRIPLLLLVVTQVRAADRPPGILLLFASDNGGITHTDPPAGTNRPFKCGKWCDPVTDCTDFLPASSDPERTWIWLHPINASVKHPDLGTPLWPNSAIRVGDHKRILNRHGRPEPYDIPGNSGEAHDLSEEKAEPATELHQRLKQRLKENAAPRYWQQRDQNVSSENTGRPFPFRDLR